MTDYSSESLTVNLLPENRRYVVQLLPVNIAKELLNIMFMEEVAGLTVQLTTSPEDELLMCINAEPGGRRARY